ncbi:TPA: phage protein NinX family protein [Morganella morganii]
MNKYRDKSDFEINKAVAEVINPGKIFTQAYSFGDTCGNSVQWIGGYAEYIHVDYCNNPYDAMPIIIENKIDLTHLVGDMVCAKHKEYWCIRKNPYRAGCEVYLLMKDAENEKV